MRILTTLLLWCLVGAAAAQTVSGVVTGPEAAGSTPVPLLGANVVWNTGQGTATDPDGKWSMEVPAGAQALYISYTGYKVDTVTYTGQTFIETTLTLGQELGQAEVEAVTGSQEMSLLDPAILNTMNEKELCKAACCNLSESFETNASIDASFTDAVSGTRQIRMLGLSGRYVQMMQDNLPSIRGLAGIYGMAHIPGPWISSIQIAKGVGSVTNGHESITGQINTTIKNPNNSEDKFYLNLFHNMARRSEANAIWNIDVNERWSTSLQLHGMYSERRFDMNGDGFIDAPLKEHVIARNSWHYSSPKVFGEYTFTYIDVFELAGQMDYSPDGVGVAPGLWGAETATRRYFATAKTGFLFPGQDWKSIGTQVTFNYQDQSNDFGVNGYAGTQQTVRVNLLYASKFDQAAEHTFTSGVSLRDDQYVEAFNADAWERHETVVGAFTEYNWSQVERFTLVGGLRADYNALVEKVFVQPRLHFRYSLTDQISLKGVAGKGVRSAAVIMENVGLLASSRHWRAEGALANVGGFAFQPEEAWNMGLSYMHKFRLNYRDASLALDGYHTLFTNQVVVDVDRDAQQVNIYNLDGQSYSTSLQAELTWTPARRWDVRLAYRWLDVQTDYQQADGSTERRQQPMVSRNRAFLNTAYETRKNDRGGQWRADATVQWIGQVRLPITSGNPEPYQIAEYSEDFVLLNAQITWAYSDKLEFYLGSENILNFRQDSPIVSADQPFGVYFDASMVWGPIFGRNAYSGLRWRIQ